MSQRYIRVSAQNLAYSVYDTNDLATIKGGSAALIDGVVKLEDYLKKYSFKSIFVGASELYGTLTSQETDKAIEDECQAQFNSNYQYAVSVYEAEHKNALDEGEKLNRRKQYQKLSFARPDKISSHSYCDLDGIRPVAVDSKHEKLSYFTQERKEQGRNARKGLHFAQSFHDLLSQKDEMKLPPALSGKIALIYMDGNSFGTARKEAKDLTLFSKTIKDKQAAIHQALINYMSAKPRYDPKIETNEKVLKYRKDKETPTIRFETLLYGGDEMMFAVPAYEAWNVVQEILNELPKDNFNLTYSIGVAFAHVKTPIRALSQLVDELCEEAKNTDKNKNCVSLFACESVDIPLGGLSSVRQKLFGLHENTHYAFTDYTLATVWMKNVIKEIPKSQAMKMARDLQRFKNNDEWFNHLKTEFERVYGNESETKNKLLSEQCFFHVNSACQLPLLTALLLWDYAEAASNVSKI